MNSLFKRMGFRFVIILAFFVLSFGCLSLQVEATTVDSGIINDTIQWRYEDNGTLTISGSGSVEKSDDAFPWFEYTNYIQRIVITGDIDSIGDSGFKNYTSIKELEIDTSVNCRIQASAFYGCVDLTDVYLSENVSSIAEGAFCGCSSVERMTLPFTGSGTASSLGYIFGRTEFPGSVKIQQEEDIRFAFSDSVPGLRPYNYYIPETLTDITIIGAKELKQAAFSGCSNLKNITLPEGLETINDYCFWGCNSLKTINIPESVNRIGKYAFYWCNGLTSITIPNNASSIGKGAFWGCKGLKTLKIPFLSGNLGWLFGGSGPASESDSSWSYYGYADIYTNATVPSSLISVFITNGTSISSNAFKDCIGIKAIDLNEGMTSIGSRAFSGCAGLVSISIPKTVVSIGEAVFRACNQLKSISIPFVGRSQQTMGTSESVLGYFFGSTSFDGAVATEQYYKQGSSVLYYIPESLKHVEITNTSQIGYGAFYGCTGLESIVLPQEGLTSISGAGFKDCSSLKNMQIYGSVESIGDSAFSGCSQLNSLTITGSIGTIGKSAFFQDSNLTKVYVNSLRTWSETEFANAYANPMMYASTLYVDGTPLGNELVIPEGTSRIGSYSYYSFNNLRFVSIPDSVRTIGRYAFADCVNLESVSIPDSVTNIGEGAFDGCECITANVLLGISFSDPVKTLSYGEAFSPTVNYLPSEGVVIRDLLWSSSNESVATVNDEGIVNACGVGNAVITAISGGIQESYTVIVNKADPQYTTPEELTAICYQQLNSVDLPEGFSWNDSSLDVGGTGEHVFKAVFTPNDTNNYNVISNIDIPVVVQHGYSDNWNLDAEFHWKECACGDIAYKTVHTFGSWRTIQDPTCVDEGVREHECLVCGFIETEPIEPKGHNWYENPTIDQQPTCTEDGVCSVHCKDCNARKDEAIIEKLGHAYGSHVVAASCTQSGYTLHICGRCGDSYTDSETEPAGHSFGEWVIDSDSTCTNTGIKTRTCNACGYTETSDIAIKEHNWDSDYTIDKEATCTTDGSKSIHCKDCDAVKDSEVIEAVGHDFTEWRVETEPTCLELGLGRRICRTCAATETLELAAKGHDWKTEYTIDQQATCTEAGRKSIHCKDCDTIKEDSAVEVPAKGHSYGDWETIKEPTCAEEGEAKRVCKACDNTETKTLNKKAHDWKTEYTIDQEVTCTEAGSKSIHCKDCDVIKEDSAVEVPAKGHSYGNWETTKEPTCAEEGEAKRVCESCNSTETKALSKKTHDWKTEYTIDQEATCTETGSKSIHCKDCDAIKEDSAVEVPAKGHSYGNWETTKEPTCAEEGEAKRVCKSCNNTETKTLNKKAHDWKAEYTIDQEATCTEAGSKSIHCKDCDAIKEDTTVEISPIGHTFGNWELIQEPTCTEQGEREHECSICGYKETQLVVELGHHYSIKEVEPTCTQSGYTIHVCFYCGDSYTDNETDALGHDFTDWHTVDVASCTNEGSEQRECKTCGLIETRGVERLDHDWDDDYTIDKEPTCVLEGSKSIHCKNCDTVKDSVVLPSLGHQYTEWTQIKEKTCLEDGEATRHCTICNEEEVLVFPATGHHQWDEGVVTKEPTNTEPGVKTYTCEICKETRTEDIEPFIITGWQEKDGNWYYYDENGVMVTGWSKIDNHYYYFNEQGEMLTGKHSIDGSDHYFNSDGTALQGWNQIDDTSYYFNEFGAISENLLHGIDVSRYNGVIDWAAVKESGIQYAIIRCGWGDNLTSNDDSQWAYNVAQCEKLGIPYGVYIYSYATSATHAQSEAEHCLRLLTGHHPSFPVYIDFEDRSLENIPSDMLASITQTWATRIKSAGYVPGVYASKKWWTNKLIDPSFNNYTKWVAQWDKPCNYVGSYSMWQYTASGVVNGLSDIVNMNYWYTGWQEICGAKYYCNDSGIATGWQTIDGKKYYFKTNGVMTTGWQKIDGIWYYFNGSGAMVTGWQKIGGTWYYFKSSGAMATGWQKIGGSWYYLNTSGAMVTGWQKIGGTWYYFKSSGAMVTGTVVIAGKTYKFSGSGAWIG